MPNWCTNRLIVIEDVERYGEGGELQKFVESITLPEDHEDQHDLTLPYPTPEILLGTRSPMQTRESVEKMRVDRDAGKLKAHDGHPGPLTANGSWCTDERLQADLDQIEQGEKAEKEILSREEEQEMFEQFQSISAITEKVTSLLEDINYLESQDWAK